MTDILDALRQHVNRLEGEIESLRAIRRQLDPYRLDVYSSTTEGPNREETDEEVLTRLLPDPHHKTRLLNALVNGDGIPLEVIIGWEGGSGMFVPKRETAHVTLTGDISGHDYTQGGTRFRTSLGSMPALKPGDKFNTHEGDAARANRLLPVGSRVYAVLGSYRDSITRTSDGWRVDAVAPLPCRRVLPPLVGGHYEVVRVGPEKREWSVGDKVTDADTVPCGLVVVACGTIDYMMDEAGRWTPAPPYTGPTSDTLRALSSEPFFVRHVPRRAPPPTRLRIGDVMEGPDGSRRMVVCEGLKVVPFPEEHADGTISLAPGVRMVGNVLDRKEV